MYVDDIKPERPFEMHQESLMKINAKNCRYVVSMVGVIAGLFIVPVSETGAYDGSQVLPR